MGAEANLPFHRKAKEKACHPVRLKLESALTWEIALRVGLIGPTKRRAEGPLYIVSLVWSLEHNCQIVADKSILNQK